MTDRLHRMERALLCAFFIALLALGVSTLARSALLKFRHTDAGVYFRAAWAVQHGTSIYEISDDNAWRYQYPPLLAILLVPLADAPSPPCELHQFRLSYAAAIVVWYAVNVGALAAGVHLLAGAIETTSPSPALRKPLRFGRRWWRLRFWPVLVCLPMIGNTLTRGQVNLIVLLCLCGMTAAILQRRNFTAGLALAAAICIKVFPAYLLLYPMWRGAWRCLAGCAAGLVLGLIVVPVAAMGLDRTTTAYREYAGILRKGALAGDAHPSDSIVLNESGDVQSFKAVLFKISHPNPETRPPRIPRGFWIAHIVIGAVLTGATLRVIGFAKKGPRAPEDHLQPVLAMGALATVVLPIIPTAQDHYFAVSTLLVLGLIAAQWEGAGSDRLPGGWALFFTLVFVLSFVSELPGLRILSDFGVVILAELLLWSAGIRELWLRRQQVRPLTPAGLERTEAPP